MLESESVQEYTIVSDLNYEILSQIKKKIMDATGLDLDAFLEADDVWKSIDKLARLLIRKVALKDTTSNSFKADYCEACFYCDPKLYMSDVISSIYFTLDMLAHKATDSIKVSRNSKKINEWDENSNFCIDTDKLVGLTKHINKMALPIKFFELRINSEKQIFCGELFQTIINNYATSPWYDIKANSYNKYLPTRMRQFCYEIQKNRNGKNKEIWKLNPSESYLFEQISGYRLCTKMMSYLIPMGENLPKRETDIDAYCNFAYALTNFPNQYGRIDILEKVISDKGFDTTAIIAAGRYLSFCVEKYHIAEYYDCLLLGSFYLFVENYLRSKECAVNGFNEKHYAVMCQNILASKYYVQHQERFNNDAASEIIKNNLYRTELKKQSDTLHRYAAILQKKIILYLIIEPRNLGVSPDDIVRESCVNQYLAPPF